MMGNNLPLGWVSTKLSNVTVPTEKVAPDEKPEQSFFYIDIAAVDNEKNRITEPKEIIGKEAPSRARQLVRTGDTLFSTVRTYLKNIAFVENQFDNHIASTGFAVIRPKSLIEGKYIYYYTLTNHFLESLNQLQRGISYPAVKNSDVFDQLIPLPPLAEQQRIVAKLDALMEKVDSARERLEKIPANLKRFRQAVLAAAVSGRLTADWREQNQNIGLVQDDLRRKAKKTAITDKVGNYALFDLPQTWRWVSINDVADVKGGKRLPKGESLVKENTGFPYIKAGSLKNGTVLREKLEYLKPEVQVKIKRYIVSKGDVYLTNVGACIGDAGIIPNDLDGANLTENALKICNLNNITNCYLSYWLQSSVAQAYIEDTILSGAQGKLALGRVQSFPVPLSPITEQLEIARRIEKLFDLATGIEARYNTSKSHLDQLPQAILAKAFRGELVPQDPNDEPASVLLERIQAEEESTGKKGKKSASPQLTLENI